jgi:NAD(P)-dependent dehydrogenase (short-subunit alcohol dehydrogenase family)
MRNIDFRFNGAVVAVTGAATGIGRAIAQAFAGAGASTYLLDVDDVGGEVAAECGGTFIGCDVTDEDALAAAMGRIDAEQSRLDVLVNNAGGFAAQRKTDDVQADEWRRIVDLNLGSVFLVSKSALPLLRHSVAGRIINIGSLAAQLSTYTTAAPYAAAKAGVHALTRVLASELAPEGITVNAIAPSAVLTERIVQLRDEEERAATARTIPLGRYQDPDELAHWVLFLASAEAGFATGQTLGVNGGRYMG